MPPPSQSPDRQGPGVGKGIDVSKAIKRDMLVETAGKQTRLGPASSFDEAHSIVPASAG